MSAPYCVLSLGAGVQSSTMALMASHGEFGRVPDAAIFADTGDEPAAVYEHLRWLMSPNVLPFPVHVVTAGNLSQAMLGGNDMARIPFFVGAGGVSGRQCTRNFKLRPIRKEIRRLLGKGPRNYIAPGAVEQWVGISYDERHRIKPSGAAFITRRDPLVERRIRRRDCIRWLTDNGYPIPPKSACIYCPYQSDEQRKDQKENQPEEFAQVVLLDLALRSPENIARFRGELYVHRSRQALGEVDLSSIEDRGQGLLFAGGCEEGMCGV